MNPKAKSWILHYLYGAFAAIVNGTFSTAYVSFGAAGADVAGLVDLKSITWRGFLSVLVGTITYHAVNYFKTHPIPDELPDGIGGTQPESLSSAMLASQTKIPAALTPSSSSSPILPVTSSAV